MPAPIRELMHFTAPVHFTVEGEGEGTPIDTLVVKGFASVETNDRSGDLTNPFEFNVKEFMAVPTLLINHKFWVDTMGNNVAIGRVLTMNPARLQKSDDPDLWNVQDIRTREIITTFPKAKVPSLRKGTRGLFVTAEITQLEVIGQVARGELSGMSWRGLTEVGYEVSLDGTTRRVLKDIDLFEVSITHIPDHNQSTFVVGKNVDGEFVEVPGMSLEDVQLWRVELPKSKFETPGMAIEYLKAHNLTYDNVKAGQDSYIAEQVSSDTLDLERTVRIKMAEAFMLMAPPLEPPKGGVSYTRLVAELVGAPSTQVDVAKSLETPSEETSSMSTDTKTGAAADAATEATPSDDSVKTDVEKAADTAKTTQEAPETKVVVEKTAAEKNLEVLSNTVATGVVSALEPTLKQLGVSMQAMGDGLKTMAEKMAGGVITPVGDETDTKTDTKTETDKAEVAKSAETLEGVMGVLNGLAENLQATQRQVVEVAKSAAALGETVPNPGIERAESVKTDVEKSSISGKDLADDPNAVFDGSFPWLES